MFRLKPLEIPGLEEVLVSLSDEWNPELATAGPPCLVEATVAYAATVKEIQGP